MAGFCCESDSVAFQNNERSENKSSVIVPEMETRPVGEPRASREKKTLQEDCESTYAQ